VRGGASRIDLVGRTWSFLKDEHRGELIGEHLNCAGAYGRHASLSSSHYACRLPLVFDFGHNRLIGSEKATHLTVEEIIIEDLSPTFHALRTVDSHATYST
jgi:hypothetical protein